MLASSAAVQARADLRGPGGPKIGPWPRRMATGRDEFGTVLDPNRRHATGPSARPSSGRREASESKISRCPGPLNSFDSPGLVLGPIDLKLSG